MTWESEMREWLDSPMAKGVLSGGPLTIAPPHVAADLMGIEMENAIDIVTEVIVADGTVHPAVIRLPHCGDRDDLPDLIEDPQIDTRFLHTLARVQTSLRQP